MRLVSQPAGSIFTMTGAWSGGYGGWPCEWPFGEPCCPAWDEASDAERERARRVATYLLWAATGRQYGRCEVTIRPCRRSCVDSGTVGGHWSGNTWTPILDGGRWFNIQCGCGGHRCSCTEVCEIELPGWLPEPVEIQVDGESIPLSEFRVDDGRRLVWESGKCFPLCQQLDRPLGAEGTWAITYKHGLPVPPGGGDVVADLACEIVKACDARWADECQLPSNVRRVTRQGVDIEFLTPDQAPGDFGIFSVNAWVKAANPYKLVQPVQVYSPDVQRPVVTTWQGW